MKKRFLIEFECTEAGDEELTQSIRDTLSVLDMPNGDTLYLADLEVTQQEVPEVRRKPVVIGPVTDGRFGYTVTVDGVTKGFHGVHAWRDAKKYANRAAL